MRSLRWCTGAWVVLVLAGSAAAQGAYNCLPTCSSTDARFLAIANGASFITLSQPTLDLDISVPKGTTTFTIGIFDGDARGVDATLTPHWDQGLPATFSYTLYADPQRNHTAAIVTPLSALPVQLSTTMPDNAWIDYTVNTDPSAQSPSGNYFYLLRIQLITPGVVMTNAFKVRTGGANVGGSALFPSPQPFSYIANVSGTPDVQIVYPAFPALTPTLYDGSFSFYYEQPVSQLETTVWDGDFDFGSFDGTTKDTDDPDTPGAPFLPSWATMDAVPEGIATGLSGATGSPPDDRSPAGLGLYLYKPPSIFYDLIFPDGQTFHNDNPSGNQEWEQFTVSTAPFDRSLMDFHTEAIPPGVYQVKIQGLDMQNLNALLLPGRALCVSEDGVPCTPLYPYLLGDSVFVDTNGNGVQDSGEAGIPGVTLELLDERGYLLGTTVSDASGHYAFEVDTYAYTVRVATANSTPGGPLVNHKQTTPQQCQAVISTDNVLTCDFGYRKPGAVGDRIWYDADGDGVQDSGEAGINGVTVRLYDSGGNLVATDVTHGDGNYAFTNLPVGTYTVKVDPATLPAGLAPTYDLDGAGTANTAAGTISGGDTHNEVDFGYRGALAIGDRVWKDTNTNGAQDSGEPGINGVTVQLLDAGGTVIATTTTSGDGNYSFQNLPAGTYTLRVVSATLPAGATPTYDADGTATAHQATVNLAASRPDIDFGYRVPPGILSIGDRVWKDANANGLQDVGEVGLNGVTVQLLSSGGTVLATTTTAGDGNYQFIELAPGTYKVRVVTSSLPSGFTPTYDLDGTSTSSQATVALTASRSDVDFGYHIRSGGCTGTATLGYWKTHASSWPVQSITVGGVTYTKTQAIQWLSTSPRGDETISLFQQLVPAELNALSGNSVSCITATIQAADAWLRQYPLGSRVSPSSSAGQVATDLQEQLDDYNNGRLCAPHRD